MTDKCVKTVSQAIAVLTEFQRQYGDVQIKSVHLTGQAFDPIISKSFMIDGKVSQNGGKIFVSIV